VNSAWRWIKKHFLSALDQSCLILYCPTIRYHNSLQRKHWQLFRKRLPLIPFILITGTVSEEFAAGIIKLGADDYILKDRLARLHRPLMRHYKKKVWGGIKRSEKYVNWSWIRHWTPCMYWYTWSHYRMEPQAEKIFGWKEKRSNWKKTNWNYYSWTLSMTNIQRVSVIILKQVKAPSSIN